MKFQGYYIEFQQKNAPDEPVIFAFGRNIKKRPFPLLYGKQLAYFQVVTLTCGILP
jgi:hypothetical protein